jgi:hypothetical protein
MAELDTSVRNLCAKAQDLSLKSDQLSDLIDGVNTALREANLGIELFDTEAFCADDGKCELMVLGWSKMHRNWELVVVPAVIDGDDVKPDTDADWGGLADARQDVRIHASKRLPTLIAKLTAAVDERRSEFKEIEPYLETLPDEWRRRSAPSETEAATAGGDDDIPF